MTFWLLPGDREARIGRNRLLKWASLHESRPVMMNVELSELSRCCTVYLRHSSFSLVSEVQLPPPSGSEPQAQVGLNLGSDNNPPTSRSPRRPTRLLTSTTRRQNNPNPPTIHPLAQGQEDGRPTSVKRTSLAARALPARAGGSGRVREVGRQHEECTSCEALYSPDFERAPNSDPFFPPRSLPLSSTTWPPSLRRRYSTACASSSERRAWCSPCSRRVSTASSCSRKSTGAIRRSIESPQERKIHREKNPESPQLPALICCVTGQ